MTDSIICKNCETDFKGSYCPNCKQSAHTSRITWHELGHHLIHAFFHVDRGILYSVSELFLRPGKTIRDYLEGKRSYHFNPFLFLILLASITSLLFSAFHISLIVEKFDTETIENINPVFAHKHFTIIGVIILVFLTLTDFIFYRKNKYSVPELLVSNAFQIGEFLFFLILMFPFLYLQDYFNSRYHTNIELRYPILLIIYGYLFLVRYQLYEAKSNYKIILKIIIQLILLYIVVQNRIGKLLLETVQ